MQIRYRLNEDSPKFKKIQKLMALMQDLDITISADSGGIEISVNDHPFNLFETEDNRKVMEFPPNFAFKAIYYKNEEDELDE